MSSNIVIYFLLVLLCGAFINAGWFTVTRGQWYTLPDGTRKYKGKLFCIWSKFWEQYKQDWSNPTIYVNGEKLNMIYSELERVFGSSVEFFPHENGIWIKTFQSSGYFEKNWWRMSLVRPELYMIMDKPAPNVEMGHKVTFYEIPKIYKFPEWIRHPLSSCIYCFGSIYGSFTWWVFASVYGLEHFTMSQLVVLWIPYCLSLSIAAAWIWKKV